MKWLCLAMCSLIAFPVQAQVVSVTGGEIEGRTEGAISAFKGVPYATPPVGGNRWKVTQPVKRWVGVRSAADYGSDCAQAPFPPDSTPVRTKPAEDCLFLNLWKPASVKAGAGLPVMVWIHGGGFVNGGTSPAVFSGEHFARDGIILVSINYRLGRFGFFAHPGLEAEGFGGNFGFMDQIAALQWVKTNIAAFGGDPGRVTIFGESAGGMSVHMLLQSPLSRGLFHGAIIQSGGGRATALAMPSVAEAAKAGTRFAPDLTATQLRALPADKVTGDLSMFTMSRPDYSGPMVDGKTIFGLPLDGIAAGLYARVPVIIGANSADGFPFVTDKEQIFGGFGKDVAKARLLYDPRGETPGVQVATLTSADAMFIEPARAVARALANRGQSAFLYRFAHVGVTAGSAMGGAPHASELPYVFDWPELRRDALETGMDRAVAAQTHRYWVNFAKTGRPDDGHMPVWPAAMRDDKRVHIIVGAGSEQAADPAAERLDFVEQRASQAR